MKTLLALLILFGAGGYYIYTIRQENAKMKEQMDKMAALLSDADKANLNGTKPMPTNPDAIVRKRVVCGLCKGEGSLMVRRTVNASVEDLKTLCPLCMGNGKREFNISARAELCPDCSGMGKRVVYTSKAKAGRSYDVNALGGFVEQAPTTTSCSRCLGKGAFLRPGLK